MSAAPAVAPQQSGFWNRELQHFPKPATRFACLAIVVLATIVLYYQFYLAGAVAAGTEGKNGILVDYHMSFVYYVNIAVIGYILGAAASFATGMADRYGRANIVTVGLFVVGLLCLIGIPLAKSKLGFGIVFVLIGLVEGIILVATPALIRDFSPQLGRASAMGFRTLGPVLGSLAVSIQVSNTSVNTSWRDHYIAAGVVGLVVAALSAAFLRELAPQLRDQLMVSDRDRALIEARAKGIDVAAAMRSPFRQMLKPDIILSAFAISVFLIIYYVAVGFFPAYFQTIFGFSQNDANGLGNWNWAFNAGALLVIGFLSDKARVRKPFMVVGAIGAIVFTLLFLQRATHPDTGYYTFVWLLIGLSVSLGVAYAPWMASFTETVERRNPALTATGLAVWGLVIRIVIAISVFIVPHVVNTVTTLVEKGPAVSAAQTRVETAHPGLLESLQAHPDVVAKIKEIEAKEGDVVAKVQANQPLVQKLLPYASDPSKIPPALLAQAQQALGASVLVKLADPKVQADLLYLQKQAPAALGAKNLAALADPKIQTDLATLNSPTTAEVVKASVDSPKQWQHYFWIAIGGQILFIPMIFLMAGYWSTRRARQAEAEHEAWVEAELAKLR
jgi:MFS transporter, ACS family, D-galactonate transporter